MYFDFFISGTCLTHFATFTTLVYTYCNITFVVVFYNLGASVISFCEYLCMYPRLQPVILGSWTGFVFLVYFNFSGIAPYPFSCVIICGDIFLRLVPMLLTLCFVQFSGDYLRLCAIICFVQLFVRLYS